MFNMKKLSSKIALIVVAAVLFFGGAIAFYFEMRLIGQIELRSSTQLQHQTNNAATKCDTIFSNVYYAVRAMRTLVESSFNVDEYKMNRNDYFDTYASNIADAYISNIVKNDYYVYSAYFAVHPNLTGIPLVNEVYYETSNGGATKGVPQSYSEYIQEGSVEMQWFYGAYNTGSPYWTNVHDFDGVVMVSYAEPLIIGGDKVGVVGMDIDIDDIIDIVKEVKVLTTGFAIIEDNYGQFVDSNDFIRNLSTADKRKFQDISRSNPNDVFKIDLAGTSYISAQTHLSNGYSVYLLAPSKEYNADITRSITLFTVIFPTVLIIVVILGSIIGKTFSKPLIALSSFMTKAGATGDISLSPGEKDALAKHSQNRDEIGQTIASSVNFINRISEISSALETISTGDLTTKISLLSEKDIMGRSLHEMNMRLHEMFDEINQSATQVSSGSKQIADVSQTLAQGATEQAASIEELSSSILVVAENTKINTSMAEKAALLADSIKQNAEKGSVQMDEMVIAVNEINEASGSIGKVIKVIDDIAFQTNILALNAAVEAARAGQHGKGFAVVADEVRSLAAKSAQAAKETSGLIENSMDKAVFGVTIANETARSLEEIVTGISESNQLINEIAHSSEEQSKGITHISQGIDQVAQVVQQNSATAQQSAAASEEMNGQAIVLHSLVSHFKLDSDTLSLPR